MYYKPTTLLGVKYTHMNKLFSITWKILQVVKGTNQTKKAYIKM